VIRRQDPPATDSRASERQRVSNQFVPARTPPTVGAMPATHRARVEATLANAAINHAALLERLPPEMRATLPVDAQGLTEAIDFVAEATGWSSAQRRALVRPHERAVVAIAARLDEVAGG
jgi:hypothetical protein